MTEQRAHNDLHGIINVDKPRGLTSAKTVYRVRTITGHRKIGHAGTLDPGATGVLIVCLGRATKLTELLMDQPKVYRAAGRLDVTSESLDSDSPLVPVHVASIPEREAIEVACRSLEGEIMQVPPQISALKVGGQPAYKRARHGQIVELAPRPVRIDWIQLHAYTWPELDFEICCGRGTYIRALIRDIGAQFGAGGCLTSLVRTRIGPFAVEEAWTLDALRSAHNPRQYLIERARAEELLRAEPKPIDRPAPGAPPHKVIGSTGKSRVQPDAFCPRRPFSLKG